MSTGARGPSCPCFLEPGTGTDGSPNLKPPTGHRTWSRLNGYHALIWGYLFLWYLFLCRSFNIHKTLHKSKAKQKEKSKGNGSKRITEACQIKILTDPHGRLRWGVIKRACGNHAVFFSSNQICGDCFPANSVKWIQGPGLLDGGWFLHVVRFLSPQNNNIIWVFSAYDSGNNFHRPIYSR